MTTKELLRTRLDLQRLARPDFQTPADVVRHFGAVQAGFLGALWAVGQRMKDATELSVEQALNDRSIVRSWPMRGTLHFVVPEDLRWMLDLLAPRIIHKTKSIIRGVGLTDKDFTRSHDIVEKVLEGGKTLDRPAIYKELKKGKVNPDDTRGIHILCHLAMQKVICFGPRNGKQQTFALLDEWIPKTNSLSKEESMASIALRYFQGHGPASVHDLAWWTGLTITEATQATEMIAGQLEKVSIDDTVLYLPHDFKQSPVKPSARLLPAFDEFLIGYQDRSASESALLKKGKNINAIFTSTLTMNGLIAGTWKRTITGKGVKIEVRKLEKPGQQAERAVQRECRKYAAFIGARLIA